MSEAIFLTPAGLEKLKKELEHLKTVERLEVANMIGEAKSFGDLSENSEYDAAKNKEAQLEGKIYEIQEKLKNYILVDESMIDTSRVNVGCTITLFDGEFNEEVVYKIMGSTESDPINGLISNQSPIGRALMGKKKNDIVKVETPGGVVEFKILKISA
ncbi:MAG: transcription elongation factor GreA [Clostridia bacterium]|nr:transcription elongation factor GreA [Clostridia bacterium]